MKETTKKVPAAYVLRQAKTNAVVMEAANRIMHYEGYVSLYAQYPAVKTKILICRIVKEEDSEQYGFRFHQLMRYLPDEGEQQICCCIPEQTLNNSGEVQEHINKAAKGRELFRQALQQFTEEET